MVNDNKKIVLEHTMKELEKVLSDLKNGKIPTFPKSLKKISEILTTKVPENESDVLIDKIAEDIKNEQSNK